MVRAHERNMMHYEDEFIVSRSPDSRTLQWNQEGVRKNKEAFSRIKQIYSFCLFQCSPAVCSYSFIQDLYKDRQISVINERSSNGLSQGSGEAGIFAYSTYYYYQNTLEWVLWDAILQVGMVWPGMACIFFALVNAPIITQRRPVQD